jgi:hypothetical protein
MYSKVLLTGAVAMLVAGCSELGAGTGQISKRIGEITRDPSSREVDLAKLTSFGWEYFHYFNPGTTREEICTVIGANRNQCGRIIRYERVPATHVALLFGLNGNLTHTELHALENGEFDMPPLKQGGYPKSASVFTIRRGAGGTDSGRIFLEPKRVEGGRGAS